MIIALVGQKGGSGKTTVATSLAAEGIRRKLSVLLVDADPQGTALTWGQVGSEEENRTMPTVARMGASMHKADQLPRMAKAYDLCIVDCPPRHGEIQRAALMVADFAILPCGPSSADAWALAESVELVREAQALRPKLVVSILITRKQERTALGQGARKALSEAGLPILRAELGFRVAYQEALGAGSGVTDYAAGSTAAEELTRLYDELFGGKRKHGKA